MAHKKTKIINLGGDFGAAAVKLNGLTLKISADGKRLDIISSAPVTVTGTNIHTPQTSTAIIPAQKALETGDRMKDGTIVIGVNHEKNIALFAVDGIFAEKSRFDRQDYVVERANELALHGHNDWRRVTDSEANLLGKVWHKVASPALQGFSAPWFWGATTSGYDSARIYCGGSQRMERAQNNRVMSGADRPHRPGSRLNHSIFKRSNVMTKETAYGDYKEVLEVGDHLVDGTVVLAVDLKNNTALLVPKKIFGGKSDLDHQKKVVDAANKKSLHGHKDWRGISDTEARTLGKHWDKVAPCGLRGSAAPFFWGASALFISNNGDGRGGSDGWNVLDRFHDPKRPIPVVRTGLARLEKNLGLKISMQF